MKSWGQNLIKELWQAAVTLRGAIEPADYKRYVLPIIFLRFLSLRYERRRLELEELIANPSSDYHTPDKKQIARILAEPDEYRSAGAFIVQKARSTPLLRLRRHVHAIRQLRRSSGRPDCQSLASHRWRSVISGAFPRFSGYGKPR